MGKKNRRIFNVEKDVLEKLYLITKDGEVYRKKDGYKYIPTIDQKGYYRLRLTYPNAVSSDKRYPFKLHRLVAMFHLNDYSENLQVNHKNGIKTDNRAENLEMVTNQQNVLHAWRELDSTNRIQKLSNSLKLYHNRKNGKY